MTVVIKVHDAIRFTCVLAPWTSRLPVGTVFIVEGIAYTEMVSNSGTWDTVKDSSGNSLNWNNY